MLVYMFSEWSDFEKLNLELMQTLTVVMIKNSKFSFLLHTVKVAFINW